MWDGIERKTIDEFWSDLAWSLIDNKYIQREQGKEEQIKHPKVRRRLNKHRLVSAPCHAVK